MTSGKSHIQKVRKIAGYIAPLILTVVFLYFAFKDVDLNMSFQLIEDASVFWLVIFILCFLLSHVVRAYRWKIMLNSVKPDSSVVNLFGSVMIGYGVNCAVPRLGEIYRALFAGRWEGISRTSMFGTIIIERVIDILALGFSVLISVMIYSGDLYQEIDWLRFAVIGGVVSMALIVLLLWMVVKFKQKFTNGIVRFSSKISTKLAHKLSEIFDSLINGFASLKGWKNYSGTFLLTVLIMILYGLTSFLGFYLLNMNEIKEVSFGMAWVLMTISAFGIVIPTPGGTGSYHLISKSVLVAIFGFSEEVGSAYALLTHLISVVVFILSTFLMIFIVNSLRTKRGFQKETFISVFKAKKESE